jgi:hypothetical protein
MRHFCRLSWAAASISFFTSHHQANAQNDGDTLLAATTTITNTDGSSFTELLEPFTDATGGVSTLTVTVDAVAGGVAEPIVSSAVSPPLTTIANSVPVEREEGKGGDARGGGGKCHCALLHKIPY